MNKRIVVTFLTLTLLSANCLFCQDIGKSTETRKIRLPPTFTDIKGPLGKLSSSNLEQLFRGEFAGIELIKPQSLIPLELPGTVYDAFFSDTNDFVFFLSRHEDRGTSFIRFDITNRTVDQISVEEGSRFQKSRDGFEVITDYGTPQYEIGPDNAIALGRRVEFNRDNIRDHVTGFRLVGLADVGFLSYPWGTTASGLGFPIGNDRSVRFFLPNPLDEKRYFTLRSDPRGMFSIGLDGGKKSALVPLPSRDNRSLVLSDRKSEFYILDSTTSIHTVVLEYPPESKKAADQFYPMKLALDGTIVMNYGDIGELAGTSISGFVPLNVQTGQAGNIHYFAGSAGFPSSWDINETGRMLIISRSEPFDEREMLNANYTIGIYGLPKTLLMKSGEAPL